MFTGIVQGTTKIIATGTMLGVASHKALAKTKQGGSIAINGVCLTLIKRTASALYFEVMPETMRKTNLGMLKKNDLVNIESALRVGDELGGHIVQGHVDGVGVVKKIQPDGANVLVEIEIPKELGAVYPALHSSVTLDGISLTVARRTTKTMIVSLISETRKQTTWKNIAVGDMVNVEIDVLNRYIVTYFEQYAKK